MANQGEQSEPEIWSDPGLNSRHLQCWNWQESNTFDVATLIAQLELESVSIKRIFQRKNGSEVWYQLFSTYLTVSYWSCWMQFIISHCCLNE